jgi:hypothetical protein
MVVKLTSSGTHKQLVNVCKNDTSVGSIQVNANLREFSCGEDRLVVLHHEVEVATLSKWKLKTSPFGFAVARKRGFAEVQKTATGSVEIRRYEQNHLVSTVRTPCFEAYEVTGLDVSATGLVYCTKSKLYVYSDGFMWSKSAPAFGSFSNVRLIGDGRVAVIVMSNTPLAGSWSRVELHSRVGSMRSNDVNGSFLLVHSIDNVQPF